MEKEEAVPSSGVVSLIGLAGAWVGSGSLACSASCAAKIASALLMTPYTAIDEDVLDAVAEVTNMIIGNVKTALESRLGAMGLSTPTVIYGRNFQTRSSGQSRMDRGSVRCSAKTEMFLRASVHLRPNKTMRAENDHAHRFSGARTSVSEHLSVAARKSRRHERWKSGTAIVGARRQLPPIHWPAIRS